MRSSVTLMDAFTAWAVTGGTLVPGDDADDAVWAGPAELDTLPLTEGLLDTLRSWGVA